jgi:hypothetical protein
MIYYALPLGMHSIQFADHQLFELFSSDVLLSMPELRTACFFFCILPLMTSRVEFSLSKLKLIKSFLHMSVMSQQSIFSCGNKSVRQLDFAVPMDKVADAKATMKEF